MSCDNCSSDCTVVKCVPSCVCSITIGQIEDVDTIVFIFLKNLILDRVERFAAISDETGMVILNLCPSPYLKTKYLIPEQPFELWIEKQDTVDGAREQITIGDTTGISCVSFEVNNFSGYNEWTLTIEGEAPAVSDKYLIYTALISQSGTDAPIVNILENTLGNIIWTRNDVGSYIGTLAGAFIIDKTWFTILSEFQAGLTSAQALISRIDENTMKIFSMDRINEADADDLLNGIPFEIRVYQ